MAILDKKVDLPEKIRKFAGDMKQQYPTARALLVPVMMECQKYYGTVTPEIVLAVSELLEVPYSVAESVHSFYTMILDKKSGKYIIGVCGTWNCEHAGAKELITHFCERFDCDPGEVTADGLLSLERLECLCDCHNAPSVQIVKTGTEFRPYWCNNLTVDIFDQVLDELVTNKDDALRERLVRLEDKPKPPDAQKWYWIVTTNNQYPAWVEKVGDEFIAHDGYGKLKGLKERNPKLHMEINAALMIKK